VAEERSVSDVFQDILRNLQEMVRSEIRLAKVEILGEVKQAISSAFWIAAGGVAAMGAWIFLLWTLPYALATLVSMWAATLIVALVMAAAAAALIVSGLRRAKRMNPIPERTVESVKENLEWMKQPTK
jgi:hypothetical protein